MEIDKTRKEYLERECWQCTDYIKHNPVLYPRVGDIFLRELFALANPNCKMPYSRRKKVQMDTLWYRADETTISLFETGCKVAIQNGLNLPISLTNGNEIPFYVYWYLLCLFLQESKFSANIELPQDWNTRIKKEKTQKGICKSDCRKYFKAVSLGIRNVASDFPISKNYCPLEREYECREICPVQIKIGDCVVQKGVLNYREKEELLYWYAVKKNRLPKGVLGAELLYDYMAGEYSRFFALMKEQKSFASIPISFFNCQLYAVFAYLSDVLYTHSLLEMVEEQKQYGNIKAELEKEGLWQLAERLANTKKIPDNALSKLLIAAEKELGIDQGEG